MTQWSRAQWSNTYRQLRGKSKEGNSCHNILYFVDCPQSRDVLWRKSDEKLNIPPLVSICFTSVKRAWSWRMSDLVIFLMEKLANNSWKLRNITKSQKSWSQKREWKQPTLKMNWSIFYDFLLTFQKCNQAWSGLPVRIRHLNDSKNKKKLNNLNM